MDGVQIDQRIAESLSVLGLRLQCIDNGVLSCVSLSCLIAHAVE